MRSKAVVTLLFAFCAGLKSILIFDKVLCVKPPETQGAATLLKSHSGVGLGDANFTLNAVLQQMIVPWTQLHKNTSLRRSYA